MSRNRSLAAAAAALIAVFAAGGVHAGPVNINTADAPTLAAELQGIGPALAEAIVKDRAENGPFETPEALARVRGIGPRVIEMNRENIKIED